jgi:proline racemase
MYDGIVLCMFIVFSLHQESLKLILVDEPRLEVVLSQSVLVPPKHEK